MSHNAVINPAKDNTITFSVDFFQKRDPDVKYSLGNYTTGAELNDDAEGKGKITLSVKKKGEDAYILDHVNMYRGDTTDEAAPLAVYNLFDGLADGIYYLKSWLKKGELRLSAAGEITVVAGKILDTAP